MGREGKGPGELGNFGILASGPAGTVAFIDYVNQRISFFAGDRFTGQVLLATRLALAGEVFPDSSFVGHGMPAIGGPAALTMVQTGGAQGSSPWNRRLTFDPGVLGVPDGEFVGLLDMPPAPAELPTDRDVQNHIDNYRRGGVDRRLTL